MNVEDPFHEVTKRRVRALPMHQCLERESRQLRAEVHR